MRCARTLGVRMSSYYGLEGSDAGVGIQSRASGLGFRVEGLGIRADIGLRLLRTGSVAVGVHQQANLMHTIRAPDLTLHGPASPKHRPSIERAGGWTPSTSGDVVLQTLNLDSTRHLNKIK